MESLSRWLTARLAAWRSRRAIRATIRRLRGLRRRDGLFVMAVATAGKLGKVQIGVNTVAEIDGWDYAPSADLIEKTKFGDTSHSHVVGLMDGSGSFKGRHDMTDANGQVALRNAMIAGTQVSLKLYVNAVNFYTVPALIKSAAIKSSAPGLVEIQYNFARDADDTYT